MQLNVARSATMATGKILDDMMVNSCDCGGWPTFCSRVGSPQPTLNTVQNSDKPHRSLLSPVQTRNAPRKTTETALRDSIRQVRTRVQAVERARALREAPAIH